MKAQIIDKLYKLIECVLHWSFQPQLLEPLLLLLIVIVIKKIILDDVINTLLSLSSHPYIKLQIL